MLGNAYRCGVDHKRLDTSERLVTNLIAAFAIADDDRAAAEEKFAESYLIGALAGLLGEPLAPCETIRKALVQLENHQTPVATGNGGTNRWLETIV